jgi:dTDP-4-dehydrorhamnose reductase
MNQTIVVLGYRGMLGRYVYQAFREYYSVVGVDRTVLDAETCSETDIKNAIFQPEKTVVVINCVGIIPQRKQRVDVMNRVNSDFPQMVGKVCGELGYRFINISTDCVYRGDRGRGYIETDPHDEPGEYGTSKSRGEHGDYLTVRTSIIGSDIRGVSLLGWSLSQPEIKGYTDHYWNGVTCLELAEVLMRIIRGEIVTPKTGAFHVYSPETVSKYQLLNIIQTVYQTGNRVFEYSTGNPVNRALSSVYPAVVTRQLTDQIARQREWDKNHRVVFVIGSIINTNSGVYTPEQRFQQTLDTISSIREKYHGAYIVLGEGSGLSHEQYSILVSKSQTDPGGFSKLDTKVDMFVDVYSDPDCKRVTTEKSSGEAYILFHTIRELLRKNIAFEYLYKISGRYRLNDEFADFGDCDTVVFREFSNEWTRWYSTVLYSIGWNHRTQYLDTLLRSLMWLSNRVYPDIEHCMRNAWISGVKTRSVLGVEGLVSYGGETARH